MSHRGTNDLSGIAPPHGYNLGAIRALMRDAFTAKELDQFCHDRPAFYPIRSRFPAPLNLEDMIASIIEYCEKRVLLSELLSEIEGYNPRQFDRYRSQLGPPQPHRQPGRPDAEDELTIELRIKSPDFPFHEPYYPLAKRDQELESALEVLSQTERRPAVMISGLGGIGKTALAAELARRCAEDPSLPFQAITWDSAKQELLMSEEIVQISEATLAFSDLVDSIGCQIQGPDFRHQREQEKEQSLKYTLQTMPCLIIVDNLETMENAQETLVRLQRLLGNSRALITSRQAVPGNYFSVPLCGFPESDSIAFLRRDGRERNILEIADADAERLKEVHQATDGMPLAMKLVVGQAQVLGLDEALNHLRQGYRNIYTFLFLETWRQLSDLAKNLLQYLGHGTGIVGRDELAMALEADDTALNQAILELDLYSLINYHALEGLGQRGYSVHQMTRLFVVNDLPSYWKEQGLF